MRRPSRAGIERVGAPPEPVARRTRVMVRMRHTSKLAAGFVLAIAFAGVAVSSAEAQNTITIPFAGPLSGPIATYGLETVHGALLAADEINAAEGLKTGPGKG